MGTSKSGRGSVWRVPLTVLVTLLIVCAEFGLLVAIYQRAAPTRSERIVVASLQGQLKVVAPADTPQIAAAAVAATRRLHQLGLATSTSVAVSNAGLRLAASPADPARLDDLRRTVDALSSRLAGRQHRLDLEARIGYVVLLVAASLGWMVWFRKLVSRHRALQARVSEQEALAVGEQRLAALVRNSTDVVAVCDSDGVISFVTPSIERVLGITPEDLIGGRASELVVAEDVEQFLTSVRHIGPGDDGAFVTRMHHPDGRILHVEGTVTNLVDDAAVGALVMTIRDITARVALESQLTHQAFHDSLTGLANRQLFSNRLAHALRRQSTAEHPIAVLLCDLDEFKNVNDSLGHVVGDEILAAIAGRALNTTRDSDTVARLGGDEFAILMEDTELAVAEGLAERLLWAISEPIMVNGAPLTVRASIGIAQAIPGQVSADEALRNADVAMYLAKSRGKGVVAHYESNLHAEALEKLALRAELQRGIRDGELVLHFQPTVDLSRGGLAGFEALVRWQHPTRGMLPPVLFVPMAEETGLIRALGSWVLRAACEAAVEINARAAEQGARITMAVNVGAEQLADDGFVDQVMLALFETGLEPRHLTLEITESVMLQDLNVVIERLAALRAQGIRIAIDDFGTGYSSLSYLRKLPVDILKIDKSFIDHITTDVQDAALTEGILAMSIGMNLATVAEGVEDAEQADWLTESSCIYGQGYFWSRPVPLDEALKLVSTIREPIGSAVARALRG